MGRTPFLCGSRTILGLLAAAAVFSGGPASLAAPNGAILPWRYAGWLGKSGMFVQSTPQSLLVLRVARNSPAAMAGIEGPRNPRSGKTKAADPEVLRILAVNGRTPGELSSRELVAAFTPSQTVRVAVMLGRRGPRDLEETREGPWLVDLYPTTSGKAYQLAAARRWQKALDATKGSPEIRANIVARMLFDAQQQALEGRPDDALKTLALIPRDDPGYQRALELSRQYEHVTRQARKP